MTKQLNIGKSILLRVSRPPCEQVAFGLLIDQAQGGENVGSKSPRETGLDSNRGSSINVQTYPTQMTGDEA